MPGALMPLLFYRWMRLCAGRWRSSRVASEAEIVLCRSAGWPAKVAAIIGNRSPGPRRGYVGGRGNGVAVLRAPRGANDTLNKAVGFRSMSGQPGLRVRVTASSGSLFVVAACGWPAGSPACVLSATAPRRHQFCSSPSDTHPARQGIPPRAASPAYDAAVARLRGRPYQRRGRTRGLYARIRSESPCWREPRAGRGSRDPSSMLTHRGRSPLYGHSAPEVSNSTNGSMSKTLIKPSPLTSPGQHTSPTATQR
jgi:hypothetical protein